MVGVQQPLQFRCPMLRIQLLCSRRALASAIPSLSAGGEQQAEAQGISMSSVISDEASLLYRNEYDAILQRQQCNFAVLYVLS